LINRIKQLFTNLESGTLEDDKTSLQLASAALMVEVMMIDREIHKDEERQIISTLQQHFDVSDNEAETLLSSALGEVEGATSLHQFTRIINELLSDASKFQLITQLWQVAYADNLLDKHEEAMIRRIAELIHLPHSQFIRAKKQAESANN
jgi:uncharacterized tellurite resistance protein B-like protein